METIEVDLPAVITVDLRLNEPRYVKLPDIMKAKKKPLDVTSLDALGVGAGILLKSVKTEPPAQRQKGVMVKDVPELIDRAQEKRFDLMHKILIVGEHDGKALNPATAKCVTCAKGIADAEISIVLLGADTAQPRRRLPRSRASSRCCAWTGRRTRIRWPRCSRRNWRRWRPTTRMYSVHRPVSERI